MGHPQSQPSREGPASLTFTATSDEFTNNLDTVRLKREQRIFEQERTIEKFYIVRQGLLGIFRHVYPDKKILVHKIGPGSSTGLSQCMGETPYPGQLIPLKETVAYRGTKSDVDSLCECCPADVNQLLLQENEMNGDILHKIDDIIGKDLESRIAGEVLDLADRIGQKTKNGIRIVVKFSRKQISNMTGCAHESVIRIMSKWEKKNWIETEHKQITIHRPHRLESL